MPRRQDSLTLSPPASSLATPETEIRKGLRKFHFVAQKWIRGLYNENITVPFGDRHEWRLHYKCDLAIARVVNQATRVMSPNCVVSSVDIFRVQANGAGSIITGVFVTHTVV
jgi:hypothetical protein